MLEIAKKKIPFLLDYYRNLGVQRFFIVDNDSDDKTRKFLLQQKDVHLFFTKEKFSKSEFGSKWIKILLDRYGIENWCLIVDDDEFLKYPGSEKIGLKDFCNYLDKKKNSAFPCVLLNLYPKGKIKNCVYGKGDDPLDKCAYFDKKAFEEGNADSNYSNGVWFYGGVRKRVFGNQNQGLSKVPLIKYNRDIEITMGQHLVKNAKLTKIRGVLLHFKFMSDFVGYAKKEAKRKEHWNSGSEYISYNNKLKENPNLTLYYRGSVKYKDTKQLVKMNIMKTEENYEKYLKKLK